MTLLFEEDLDEAETVSVFCLPSVGTAEFLVGALISVTVVGLRCASLWCATTEDGVTSDTTLLFSLLSLLSLLSGGTEVQALTACFINLGALLLYVNCSSIMTYDD